MMQSMYPVRIVNIRSDQEFGVQFGTCELCMHTGDLTTFYLTFEVNGQTVEMENGYWSWGDYMEFFYFDNAINFINDFNSRGFMVSGIEDITENWMGENYYQYFSEE